MQKIIPVALLLCWVFAARAENGYDLWLRYSQVDDAGLLARYQKQLARPAVPGVSPTIAVTREELNTALRGLLDRRQPISNAVTPETGFAAVTAPVPGIFASMVTAAELRQLGNEGFIIKSRQGKTIVTGNTDIAVLYGVFHFLRLLQTGQSIENLSISSIPRVKLRMLNHWDNLNRTVERGYAGFSIWNWHNLPGLIDRRYIDYARACASVGINAVSLINVNSNATVLTRPYLEKVKALADIFRPYGIKVLLTARFSAPVEIGHLSTADPLADSVRQFWNHKAAEIYSLIADFGGFLVKANSEGQPGPQDYKRSHADGANMLAQAVAPYGGIVIWRAFVYAAENPVDRHKQAYDDFAPLDGKFLPNVMVQVKNGAIDFMPREPFHPLFGAMPKTPLMMEFQITQEYLGQATNLVYLAPLYKEVLNSDTYCAGKGSTVAKVIDGSLYQHRLTGMAGVSNIGNDINWCGHPFAQANWYAYGRLCWDYQLSSEDIADEWLRMTFSNNGAFVAAALKLMLTSRDIFVQFTNPLGLHHIMGTGHHYGPAPWVSNLSRPEWNPVYYHKADSNGIGFDRTATGSNALAQYFPVARQQWESPATIDEKYLLWFHHVPWTYTLQSGRTLWNELCRQYNTGVERVQWMQQTWAGLHQFVDAERYNQVRQLLQIQYNEAVWWRNACVLYFQTFSKMPLPDGYPQPDKTLEYYKNLRFPFAPGNG